MRRFVLAALVAASISIVAATAVAAPKYSGSVSAAAPQYKWSGGPGNGSGHGVAAVRCTPAAYECEDVLIEVKDQGTLTVFIKAGAGSNDMDVSIYKANPDGSADTSTAYGEDVTTNKDAKAVAKNLKPGRYIAQVRFYDAVQGVYDGTATLAVPVAGPAPAVTPAASATPVPSASPDAKPGKAGCQAKARKLKDKRKRAAALKRCKKAKPGKRRKA